MAANLDPRTLTLRIRVEHNAGYFHVRLNVRTQDPANAYEVGDLQDLEISCQTSANDYRDPEHGQCHSYGWEYGLSRYHMTTLWEAREAERILEPIERKLAKMSRVRGSCTDYAEYVGRVAEALNISKISWETPHREDGDYIADLETGIYKIRRLLSEYHEANRKRAA